MDMLMSITKAVHFSQAKVRKFAVRSRQKTQICGEFTVAIIAIKKRQSIVQM